MISRAFVFTALFAIGSVGATATVAACEAHAVPILAHMQYQDYSPLPGLSYENGDITGTVASGPAVAADALDRGYIPFQVCGPASWAAAAMPVIVCE